MEGNGKTIDFGMREERQELLQFISAGISGIHPEGESPNETLGVSRVPVDGRSVSQNLFDQLKAVCEIPPDEEGKEIVEKIIGDDLDEDGLRRHDGFPFTAVIFD